MPVHSGDVEHASPKTYYIIGAILVGITAVEVAVFYIHALAGILIPLLLVLSVVKFVTVVQFFMHLKYDSKVLSRVFFGPLFLACLVVVGMIMLFKVIPKFAW
jgi:cytochrome c oxidase subunit 4